jgi:hypothetical protein
MRPQGVRAVVASSLILGSLFFNVSVSLGAPPLEYIDKQYHFAFQYPADWKAEKGPTGEAGEARVWVKHPTKPMSVTALVGQTGKAMSRRDFETSPNRDAVANAMIDWTVEQVYRKGSRDIGADKMVVVEKQMQPSDVGLKFHISTAHTKGRITLLLAGQHIIPFDKPYMVTFLMVTPVDKGATKDNEIITQVFNSFHILGEQPISRSSTGDAQEARCMDFQALDAGQKAAFAYGYLEGVQAALDKDVTDVLVAPADERHPMWLVLPAGLGEKPAFGLARKLDLHCRSNEHATQPLLRALLAIAHKQDGWPMIGISTDKKITDPWRSFMGGKETSLTCAAYVDSREATRQTIVHGYYLGGEALKTRLGGKDLGITWPANSTPQAVRLEVDKHCAKDRNGSLRDTLWVTTIELSVKKQ